MQKGLQDLQALKVRCSTLRREIWDGRLTGGLSIQRQTVISQFYQSNRLVVEGGISVRAMEDWKGMNSVLTVCRARMDRGTARLSGRRKLGELRS